MSGITFNTTHSWRDLGLVLTEREVGLPEVKTHMVDIPGSDGVLDLSEALAGRVLYGNRTLKFQFATTAALCGHSLAEEQGIVTALLHGKRMEITPDWDSAHSYFGRCAVTECAETFGLLSITVECDCDPCRTVRATGEQVL